jgi:translation machinery-associated protein 16
VPDLTHAANVELFRQWDVIELAYIDLLRFIRISKTDPQMAVVSRPGKHFSLAAATEESETPQDLAMDVDIVAMQQESFLPTFADPSQFRSTMMTMDGPLE